MPRGLPGGMLAAGNDWHINSLVVRGLTQGQLHCSRRVNLCVQVKLTSDFLLVLLFSVEKFADVAYFLINPQIFCCFRMAHNLVTVSLVYGMYFDLLLLIF